MTRRSNPSAACGDPERTPRPGNGAIQPGIRPSTRRSFLGHAVGAPAALAALSALPAPLSGCGSSDEDFVILRPFFAGPALEGRRVTITAATSAPRNMTVRLMRGEHGRGPFTAVDARVTIGEAQVAFEIGPLDWTRDEGAAFYYHWDASGGGSGDSDFITLHMVRLTGIDVEPADATSAAGGDAAFRVQAHGEGLSYLWQVSGPAAARAGALDGAELRLVNLQPGDDGSTVAVTIQGVNGLAASRAATLSVTARAPVVFADSIFADADWSLETLTRGRDGSASAAQATDAPAGPRRSLSLVLADPGALNPGALFALNWRQGAVYDPRVHGAARSIDYAERASLRPGDREISGALVLRQAGHVYYAPVHAVTSAVPAVVDQPSLGAGDFVVLDGTDPNRPLDLSAGGTAIEFGVLRAANAGAGSPGYATHGDIDDWRVTLWR